MTWDLLLLARAPVLPARALQQRQQGGAVRGTDQYWSMNDTHSPLPLTLIPSLTRLCADEEQLKHALIQQITTLKQAWYNVASFIWLLAPMPNGRLIFRHLDWTIFGEYHIHTYDTRMAFSTKQSCDKSTKTRKPSSKRNTKRPRLVSCLICLLGSNHGRRQLNSDDGCQRHDHHDTQLHMQMQCTYSKQTLLTLLENGNCCIEKSIKDAPEWLSNDCVWEIPEETSNEAISNLLGQ